MLGRVRHSMWSIQVPHGEQWGDVLISLVTSDRTQRMKWNCIWGNPDSTMGKAYSLRECGHGSRLPREVTRTPSLSEFSEHLGDAFSHMVCFQVVLPGPVSWTCLGSFCNKSMLNIAVIQFSDYQTFIRTLTVSCSKNWDAQVNPLGKDHTPMQLEYQAWDTREVLTFLQDLSKVSFSSHSKQGYLQKHFNINIEF